MLDQMLIYMALLIFSVIAGLIFGLAKKNFSEKEKKYTSKIMTALVFILIMLMGIKTGLNDTVISNLGSYGISAFLITISAIAGSIIFAVIFEKLLYRSASK
jgi:uncharacterized membrane protein YbjE (DUF340 family)